MHPLAIVNEKYLSRLVNKSDKDENEIVSKISKNIPKKELAELYRIAMDYSIEDCNVAAKRISDIMTNIGFREIGCGTNRIAFLKDGYVYKVALDKRGFIDNISEYKRAIEFPKYLVKVYETNRVVLVCEYCELITNQIFNERKSEIRAILDELSMYYVMDDVGLTAKNYCNWGLRREIDDDGNERDSLIIIDDAYFYPIRHNTDMLICTCGARIQLNSQYTGYHCSNSACHMTWTVPEILNKSRYDYDNGDTEIVRMIDSNGNESGALAVTGTNNGQVDLVDENDEEIKRIAEEYKNASDIEELSQPNSLSIEDVFKDMKDSDEEEANHGYQALSLDNIVNNNGGKVQ